MLPPIYEQVMNQVGAFFRNVMKNLLRTLNGTYQDSDELSHKARGKVKTWTLSEEQAFFLCSNVLCICFPVNILCTTASAETTASNQHQTDRKFDLCQIISVMIVIFLV